MAYTRTYTIDASPSGDTVKAAIATKLDGDLTDIYTHLTTHEAMTTNAHGVGSGTIVGTATTDTLTNKTLSSPTLTGTITNTGGTISGGTISGVTMTATITASGATIVSPTITGGSSVNMTIETPTLTGTIDASGATIESPTITNGTINASTLSSPTFTGDIDASGATISSPTITGATLSNPTLTGTITGISTSGGGGGSVTQTVLSSKLTSGLPTFITDPDDGLKVSIDGTPTPVVISFANGYGATGQLSEIGAIKTDTEIASLTDNTTNYLYAERNSGTGAITLGAVTVAPVYQNTAPSHAANLYWFSIPEMKMYLSNGSDTWTAKQLVFLGEAVTSGGQVTSVINYALRGVYTPAASALAAASTFTAFSHNIGVRPRIIDYRLVCTDTDLGYTVGDCLINTMVVDSGGGRGGFVLGAFGRNMVYYDYPANINGTNFSENHAISGSITPAKWAIQVYCSRGW